MTVTYHDACHLAHGQKVTAPPRELLASIPGLKVVPLFESEICCGAAGTYNLTQPGMARELADNDPQRYHVILLDAFSGDAIPAHLLTEEAFAIYLQHLAKGDVAGPAGALVVHISNRYVDLEPVVRAMAQRFGLRMAEIVNESESSENISAATYVVLSQNDELMDALEPLAEPPVDPAETPPVSCRRAAR